MWTSKHCYISWHVIATTCQSVEFRETIGRNVYHIVCMHTKNGDLLIKTLLYSITSGQNPHRLPLIWKKDEKNKMWLTDQANSYFCFLTLCNALRINQTKSKLWVCVFVLLSPYPKINTSTTRKLDHFLCRQVQDVMATTNSTSINCHTHLHTCSHQLISSLISSTVNKPVTLQLGPCSPLLCYDPVPAFWGLWLACFAPLPTLILRLSK